MTAEVISQEAAQAQAQGSGRGSSGSHSHHPHSGSGGERRTRKYGRPRLDIEPALLLQQQQQQQQHHHHHHHHLQHHNRQLSRPPTHQDQPSVASSEDQGPSNAYTVKRFLVIKYDTKETGEYPSIRTGQGQPDDCFTLPRHSVPSLTHALLLQLRSSLRN